MIELPPYDLHMPRTSFIDAIRGCRPAIAPSMLKCDFANLQREIALLEEGGAPLLHFDVMDGHFVPNLSYGPMVIRSLRSLTKLPFDAHLMISDPAPYLDEYLDAGCDCVTIHAECDGDVGALLGRIRSGGAAAGVAINPKTPVSSIEGVLSACDLVLVMSVEPGFGGQKFLPEVLEKLRDLRDRLGSERILSIDGGIGSSTIATAAQASADIFVAGSAVFDSPDYQTAITDLRTIADSEMPPPPWSVEPTMPDVVLVRPGCTDFDEQQRVQGSLDLPLSNRGRAQVEQLVEQLAEASLDVIYSSPSEPARATATAIGETLGVRVKEKKGLRNLNQGLWEGLKLDDIRRKYPKVLKQWQESPMSICPPDGEPIGEAIDRARETLQKALKRHATFAVVVAEPLASLIGCVVLGGTRELKPAFCGCGDDPQVEWLHTNGVLESGKK